MLQFEIKSEKEAKSVIESGHHIILSRFTHRLVIPEICGYMMFDGNAHDKSRFRIIYREDNQFQEDTVFDRNALYGIIPLGTTTRIADFDRFHEYYNMAVNDYNTYVGSFKGVLEGIIVNIPEQVEALSKALEEFDPSQLKILNELTSSVVSGK